MIGDSIHGCYGQRIPWYTRAPARNVVWSHVRGPQADPPSPAPGWGWAESWPSWQTPLQNPIPSCGAKILHAAAGSGQEYFR